MIPYSMGLYLQCVVWLSDHIYTVVSVKYLDIRADCAVNKKSETCDLKSTIFTLNTPLISADFTHSC